MWPSRCAGSNKVDEKFAILRFALSQRWSSVPHRWPTNDTQVSSNARDCAMSPAVKFLGMKLQVECLIALVNVAVRWTQQERRNGLLERPLQPQCTELHSKQTLLLVLHQRGIFESFILLWLGPESKGTGSQSVLRNQLDPKWQQGLHGNVVCYNVAWTNGTIGLCLSSAVSCLSLCRRVRPWLV